MWCGLHHSPDQSTRSRAPLSLKYVHMLLDGIRPLTKVRLEGLQVRKLLGSRAVTQLEQVKTQANHHNKVLREV